MKSKTGGLKITHEHLGIGVISDINDQIDVAGKSGLGMHRYGETADERKASTPIAQLTGRPLQRA